MVGFYLRACLFPRDESTFVFEDHVNVKKRARFTGEILSHTDFHSTSTAAETRAIVTGVNKYGEGQWSRILASDASFSKFRSATCLKDKWRQLKKSGLIGYDGEQFLLKFGGRSRGLFLPASIAADWPSAGMTPQNQPMNTSTSTRSRSSSSVVHLSEQPSQVSTSADYEGAHNTPPSSASASPSFGNP
eukprot:Blabericola_migrator_1__6260@NODE_3158_length_1992_cov_19_092468_g1977_i0_p2_GENE_NODE_3158_length_1992_cov_19_092468_g1977_i0NODE_3158_length_1992_cov_19_092468_g1977_i0_p2_ORF_typecomplete_len189_score20_36Myb_DNAbinding/PF00249_31/0_00014Myb_DNAbind_6/PF13921_6/0_0018_NODE_3158_length_1992_cov_19_092468_g1977_i011851751